MLECPNTCCWMPPIERPIPSGVAREPRSNDADSESALRRFPRWHATWPCCALSLIWRSTMHRESNSPRHQLRGILRLHSSFLQMLIVDPSVELRILLPQMLHECMHHQLDSVGCPALVVPQLYMCENGQRLGLGQVEIPSGSALCEVDVRSDPEAVARLVRILWELIQHSRCVLLLAHPFRTHAIRRYTV